MVWSWEKARAPPCYFGGYTKPANHKENRVRCRLPKHQTGKRLVAVVMRARAGRTLQAVFRSGSAALGLIASRALPGMSLMADEAALWNDLHGRFRCPGSTIRSCTATVLVSTRTAPRNFSAARAGPR